MIRRIYFVILMSMTLLFSGCKLGYKNLKSGNWEKDTTHVAFSNLPEEVMKTYRDYYELAIYREQNRIYGKESEVKGILYTSQEKGDTLIREVTYVDDYTSGKGDRWSRMGFYFTVGKRKLFMPYWELSTPFVLYDDILYFPTDIYVDMESEKKYKYINFVGYGRVYYVAYRLKWLTRKLSKGDD